ncbi:hypothetical protein VTI74DRAFT_390 [Chaetomium olivicolor]
MTQNISLYDIPFKIKESLICHPNNPNRWYTAFCKTPAPKHVVQKFRLTKVCPRGECPNPEAGFIFFDPLQNPFDPPLEYQAPPQADLGNMNPTGSHGVHRATQPGDSLSARHPATPNSINSGFRSGSGQTSKVSQLGATTTKKGQEATAQTQSLEQALKVKKPTPTNALTTDPKVSKPHSTVQRCKVKQEAGRNSTASVGAEGTVRKSQVAKPAGSENMTAGSGRRRAVPGSQDVAAQLGQMSIQNQRGR